MCLELVEKLRLTVSESKLQPVANAPRKPEGVLLHVTYFLWGESFMIRSERSLIVRYLRHLSFLYIKAGLHGPASYDL